MMNFLKTNKIKKRPRRFKTLRVVLLLYSVMLQFLSECIGAGMRPPRAMNSFEENG